MGNPCKICGNSKFSIVYSGPIRSGKFGQLTPSKHQVLRCEHCQTSCLDTVLLSQSEQKNQAQFYESDEYRKSVDADESPETYYRLHDAEQIRNLPFIDWQNFRGKTLADIGCGAGSFLDFVSALAEKCLAIEPSQTFQRELSRKGYTVYSYAHMALKEWQNHCDWVTSFSVLEHVEDPKHFLQNAVSLLKPAGQLLLSTPNTKDLLLSFLPSDFERFYFRQAHLWYFDETSLRHLLESLGLTEISIHHHQRFGISNFLAWARDKKPQGTVTFPFASPALDSVWKAELQRQGQSDYLFVTARKGT